MKKVLLAEDHSIVIRGMKIIFELEFSDYKLDVVKKSNDLMNAIKIGNYELAIIDLQLEDGDTMHLIPDIHQIYPNLKIVIFSANSEEIYAQKLYKDGIKGYLSKQSDDKEITTALKHILDGNIYMSERFKGYLIEGGGQKKSNRSVVEKLSQREMEVANLLQKGKKISEICQELNLQPSTVATYKKHIFEKLQVTNIVELNQIFGHQNPK